MSAHSDIETHHGFEVSTTVQDGVVVVAVLGEVDMATAPVFQEVVDEHPGEFMVVDLCSCGFMDSSGVAVVIRRHRLDPERLHVACVPKGATARIFEIAVQKTIPIHASVEDAVAALQHLT